MKIYRQTRKYVYLTISKIQNFILHLSKVIQVPLFQGQE